MQSTINHTANFDSPEEWLAAGRPAGKLWVSGRSYDMTNARRLAHKLAGEWSDRAYQYGWDAFGAQFVEIFVREATIGDE